REGQVPRQEGPRTFHQAREPDPPDVTHPMLRQLRHDVWATDQLITRCRQLTTEQLQLSVPGTYGTVLRTLQHVVSSDEGYLIRLLGVRLHEQLFRHEP